MTDTKIKQNTCCAGCGGTGQISFFKGVSRFLVSCDECPECSGLEYIPGAENNKEVNDKTSKSGIGKRKR